MSGTDVIDMDHYLDRDGEIVAEIPAAARKYASFLALIIDAATTEMIPGQSQTSIRCRKRGCLGRVVTAIDSVSSPIQYQCPSCDQNGVISNWQNTKWDNRIVLIT